MRNITLKKAFLSFLMFTGVAGLAQVTVIDPNGDGGFENGTTFAANGWTAVNPSGQTARIWYVGTGMTGYTGTGAAFIGDNATTVSAGTASRTVHFYRSISIPAGAENIQLKFKYKQPLADVYLGTIYDYIQVSTGTAVPVSGTLPTTGVVFGPYPSANVTSFTEQTVTLPTSVAGTTTNLVFSFKADTVSPNGAGGVDDISLTYTMPACPSPGGLVVIPTANSVNMSWTAPGTPPADGYQIGVTDSDTPPTTFQTVTGTSGTVGQLISTNQYYAWIRSACGNNTYSSWVKAQFTTPCDAVNVPYLENFESVTPPALSDCTIAVKTGPANTWTTSATTVGGHSSNTLRYMYSYAGAANTWFFTKGVNLTAGTSYRISYKYGGSSTYYIEKLKVAYGLTQNVAGMTNQLADYPSLATDTYSIAEHDFIPATTGVYYFGFQAYSASGQNYIYVDDIHVDVSPSCFPPTAVTATATSPNAINISWTAAVPVPGNGYEYYVSTENVAPDAATDGTDVPTGTSATYTALSNQQYYVWVRSICSSTDKSYWTQAVSIVTPCDPVSAPFVEEFSNGVKPDCWTNTSSNPVANGVWKFTGAVDYATGNTRPNGTFAWVDGSEPATMNNVTLTTPLINTAGLTLPYLVFDYYSNNTSANPNNPFTVQVQMNGTWTTVYTNNTNLAQWRTIELPLANYVNGTIQVRFVVDKTIAGVNAFYNDILIDNVKLIEAPTCLKPTGLTAVAVSSNAINISWTAAVPAPASGYEYFVSTENTAPDLTVDGTDVPTGTSATYTSMGNQQYYIWVRSVCSPTDKSEWTPAVGVVTPCDAVNAPFIEEFSNGVRPDCWTNTSSNPVANGVWKFTGAVDYATGNTRPNGTFAWADGSEPANMNNVTLTSPLINTSPLTVPYLVFDYFSNNTNIYANNPFTVQVQMNGAWTTVYTNNTNLAQWRTIELPLADYAGATIQVRFVVDKTVAGIYAFYNDILIDNVKIIEAPTCIKPAGLTAVATGANSINISWTAAVPAPANGYEYYVSTENVAPDLAVDGTDVPTGTSATYTAMSNQVYYIWVRSVCSPTDKSEWTPVVTVTTPCDAVNVPYLEDFESVTVPALPECTVAVKTGAANIWQTNAATTGGFSSNVLRYSYSYAGAANTWFFTKGVNLTAGTSYRISYKYGGTSTAYVEKLKVAYGTAATAAAMTNQLADYPSITTTTYSTAGIDFIPATTGVYYFGFQAYSASGQNVLFVDDISVNLSPTCLAPTGVTASATSTTSISISWNIPAVVPGQGYEYYVSTENVAPNAATDGTDVPTGTSATYTALSNQQYYIWVRSVCSQTDKSEWSAVVMVKTPCDAVNVPYVQDFESVTTTPALPDCTTVQNAGNGNNWTTATVTTFGFNGKVLRYAYHSANDANAWFFTQGINLTQGTTYRISYKYGNSGATEYVESMKVAYGTAPNASAMNTVLKDYPEIDFNAAANDYADFTPATSGVYYFGFNAYSELDQDRLFLDDITIDVTMSNEEFMSNSFTHYPNPVKDVLNLSSVSEIGAVEVYNMLGQKVLASKANASEAKIDMSNLADGSYIVNVTYGNSVKTIKVVKRQ